MQIQGLFNINSKIQGLIKINSKLQGHSSHVSSWCNYLPHGSWLYLQHGCKGSWRLCRPRQLQWHTDAPCLLYRRSREVGQGGSRQIEVHTFSIPGPYICQTGLSFSQLDRIKYVPGCAADRKKNNTISVNGKIIDYSGRCTVTN